MDGLYKTEEICGNTSLTKVESALETEEKKEIAQDGETEPSDNDAQPNEKVEICLNVPADRTAHVFRTALVALVCAVGFSAYAYLGLTAVRAVRERGIGEIAANYVFGGSVVRIEPQTPPTDVDEPEPPSPTAPEVKIDSEDLSVTSVMQFSNETAYDTESLTLPAAVPFPVGAEVLIIHTHGTESYATGDTVSSDENFRSTKPDESVIAVGDTIADALTARGVKVHHCTDMFDRESYIEAYSRSASAVAEYVAENPNIALVLDVHRDAIIREDNTVVKTGADGMAQLMLVCGTEEMGADFPEWRTNLAFAVKLQSCLMDAFPSLMRHINLRGASFNEQLCEKYLLLEVGSCGNTLAEAQNAAKAFAETVADMIAADAANAAG